MEVFGVALGSGEGVSGEEMVQIPSCHHSPQDEGIVGSLGSWRGHEEEEGKEQEMGLRRPQRQTSFCLRDSPSTLGCRKDSCGVSKNSAINARSCLNSARAGNWRTEGQSPLQLCDFGQVTFPFQASLSSSGNLAHRTKTP